MENGEFTWEDKWMVMQGMGCKLDIVRPGIWQCNPGEDAYDRGLTSIRCRAETPAMAVQAAWDEIMKLPQDHYLRTPDGRRWRFGWIPYEPR